MNLTKLIILTALSMIIVGGIIFLSLIAYLPVVQDIFNVLVNTSIVLLVLGLVMLRVCSWKEGIESMNLIQTQKRLDEMTAQNILYKIGNQYNMTPDFKVAIVNKFKEMRKADETIAVVLVDFFVQVNENDLVDYISIIENFIDREALKGLEV